MSRPDKLGSAIGCLIAGVMVVASVSVMGCGTPASPISAKDSNATDEACIRVAVYKELSDHLPQEQSSVLFIDDKPGVIALLRKALGKRDCEIASTDRVQSGGSSPVDSVTGKGGSFLSVEEVVMDGDSRAQCYGSAVYGNQGSVGKRFWLERRGDKWFIVKQKTLLVG